MAKDQISEGQPKLKRKQKQVQCVCHHILPWGLSLSRLMPKRVRPNVRVMKAICVSAAVTSLCLSSTTVAHQKPSELLSLSFRNHLDRILSPSMNVQ